MKSPKGAHIEALQEAGLEEKAFLAALSAMFADDALDAADRKAVAAAVTGAPARRLGSDQARRDELERWFYANRRKAGRAEARSMETSRF